MFQCKQEPQNITPDTSFRKQHNGYNDVFSLITVYVWTENIPSDWSSTDKVCIITSVLQVIYRYQLIQIQNVTQYECKLLL